ncbi:outer membrane porin GjpA [Mycobacterium sp.]|uniref:outer membrane porin GjpA n=1 Tax=Mycobacterium sp. TaxID=1785 RepID=UPI0025D05802|nr:outer membrane porin GjpA [Mycobacterium sp.]
MTGLESQHPIRRRVAAAVTLLGASLFAAVPILAPTVARPREMTLTAGALDLITPWEQLISATGTNAQAVFTAGQEAFSTLFSADPAPLVQNLPTALEAVSLIGAPGVVASAVDQQTLGGFAQTSAGGLLSGGLPVPIEDVHGEIIQALVGQGFGVSPGLEGELITAAESFASSPLSGVLIGMTGPLVSPAVELFDSLQTAFADLAGTNADPTAALDTVLNTPANVVDAFFNGATLNLDWLAPLFEQFVSNGDDGGESISALSFAFGGLFSPGSVADGVGGVANGVGGSFFNSVGMDLAFVPPDGDAGATLDVPAIGVGPIAAVESLVNIVGEVFNGSLLGYPDNALTAPVTTTVPTGDDPFLTFATAVDDNAANSVAAELDSTLIRADPGLAATIDGYVIDPSSIPAGDIPAAPGIDNAFADLLPVTATAAQVAEANRLDAVMFAELAGAGQTSTIASLDTQVSVLTSVVPPVNAQPFTDFAAAVGNADPGAVILDTNLYDLNPNLAVTLDGYVRDPVSIPTSDVTTAPTADDAFAALLGPHATAAQLLEATELDDVLYSASAPRASESAALVSAMSPIADDPFSDFMSSTGSSLDVSGLDSALANADPTLANVLNGYVDGNLSLPADGLLTAPTGDDPFAELLGANATTAQITEATQLDNALYTGLTAAGDTSLAATLSGDAAALTGTTIRPASTGDPFLLIAAALDSHAVGASGAPLDGLGQAAGYLDSIMPVSLDRSLYTNLAVPLVDLIVAAETHVDLTVPADLSYLGFAVIEPLSAMAVAALMP